MNYVFEPRINRYMLECKYEIVDGTHNQSIELIDTCWNVNISSQVLLISEFSN